jgi:hypothetical protein
MLRSERSTTIGSACFTTAAPRHAFMPGHCPITRARRGRRHPSGSRVRFTAQPCALPPSNLSPPLPVRTFQPAAGGWPLCPPTLQLFARRPTHVVVVAGGVIVLVLVLADHPLAVDNVLVRLGRAPRHGDGDLEAPVGLLDEGRRGRAPVVEASGDGDLRRRAKRGEARRRAGRATRGARSRATPRGEGGESRRAEIKRMATRERRMEMHGR